MRERLQAALKDLQSAKSKLEVGLREASEDPAFGGLRGTLQQTLENLRVCEVYTVRMISRLPAEEGR